MAERGVTRHRETLCPHCGYVTTAAGTFDDSDAKPKPGDFITCMRCVGVLQVNAEGLPAMPPFGAYEKLKTQDPAYYEAIEQGRTKIRRMHAVMGPPTGGLPRGRA